MKITRLFKDFFKNEKAGGLILVFTTLISLYLSNSPFQNQYLAIWQFPIAGYHLEHWINDGLMTIFFLMVGLELERELYIGELSKLKYALLPMIAALGGMLVPAVIHLLFNYGSPTQSGAGIPMATDIAFAIGILSLLGNRIPLALKVFLTALAVIDDLGAIFTIAIFYSKGISVFHLSISIGIFAVLLIMNRLKVHILLPYFAGGIIMWYFMLQSGIHATITGVLLAFAIPFGDGGKTSPSYDLQYFLHKPVAFIILPIFALANTSIILNDNPLIHLTESNSLGIVAGLVIGKPLGITLFTLLAVLLGICDLPGDLRFKEIFGAGMLGGIGFTMSIFISLLAFDDSNLIATSKITILISSVIAASLGIIWLRITLPKNNIRST